MRSTDRNRVKLHVGEKRRLYADVFDNGKDELIQQARVLKGRR